MATLMKYLNTIELVEFAKKHKIEIETGAIEVVFDNPWYAIQERFWMQIRWLAEDIQNGRIKQPMSL